MCKSLKFITEKIGTVDFSLNDSLNSANSVTKAFVITVQGFEPVTTYIRDQDATTGSTRHM